MPGVKTNQIATDAIIYAKFGALNSVLDYTTGANLASDITDPGHVANKAYADATAEGVEVQPNVRVATIGNLFATQLGTGVGATLTNAHPVQAKAVIDDIPLANGDRVLVKDYGGEIFSVLSLPSETDTGNNNTFTDTSIYGRYWEFVANGIEYYVWYNVDNATVLDPIGAPTPGNVPFLYTSGTSPTGIEIAYPDDQTADQMAGHTKTDMDADPVLIGVLDEIVLIGDGIYVLLAEAGSVTDVRDGRGAGVMDGSPVFNVEQEGSGNPTTGCPHNGIYSVTVQGTDSTDWVFTRAVDFDEIDEISAGAFTFVGEGTINAGTAFVVIEEALALDMEANVGGDHTNKVRLGTGAHATDDAYNGATIQLPASPYLGDGQKKTIFDYTGAGAVAEITGTWETKASAGVTVSVVSGTVTGDGSALFLTEFQVGDIVTVSNAAPTTAVITAIASNSSMTAAVGDVGASETITWVGPGGDDGATTEGDGDACLSHRPLEFDVNDINFAVHTTAGNLIEGDGLSLTGNLIGVNVDDTTLEIVTNNVTVKEGGVTAAKLAVESIGPFQFLDQASTNERYGFWVEDSSQVLSWASDVTGPAQARPQFAASVLLNALANATFVHGETFAASGGATGVFMGFDKLSPDATSTIWYLPLDGTTILSSETIIGATGSATAGATRVLGNSPTGALKVFPLSDTDEGNSYTVLSSSVEAYVNGVRQKRALEYDATRTGLDIFYFDSVTNDVKFWTAPERGDEITVRWVPQPAP